MIFQHILTLGLLIFTAGCFHRVSEEDIEARLDKLPLPSITPIKMPYNIVLNQAPLPRAKKRALYKISSSLNEDLLILKLRDTQLNNLLSQELMNPNYSRETTRTIMKMILANSKRQTWIKLEAMLKAKAILRSHPTGKNQLEPLRLSIEALGQGSTKL